MKEIQSIRAKKSVPGGRPLHDYVNLYIDARNPMMYKIVCETSASHTNLCVLIISTDVLDLPNVIITDGNAASDYTLFMPSPKGLKYVNEDIVFAEYWTDPDDIIYLKKKRIKCAEVLVPDRVPAEFINGAYVSCHEAKQKLLETGFDLPIYINSHLFFK